MVFVRILVYWVIYGDIRLWVGVPRASSALVVPSQSGVFHALKVDGFVPENREIHVGSPRFEETR